MLFRSIPESDEMEWESTTDSESESDIDMEELESDYNYDGVTTMDHYFAMLRRFAEEDAAKEASRKRKAESAPEDEPPAKRSCQ